MEIIFNNSPDHYETGQVVSGVLRVAIDQLIPSDVTIALTGVSRVHWIDIANTIYGPEQALILPPPIPFDQERQFLEVINVVSDVGVSIKGEEITFELKIPDKNMPSSFKGSYGSVTYEIVAIVKSPDDQVHQVKRKIKVLCPPKVNLLISLANTVEKDFGLLSLGSGQITMHTFIQKKAYYAGESIELILDINNDSSVECTPRATLFQVEVYMCGDRHKGLQSVLTEPVIGQNVDKHSNAEKIIVIPIPKGIAITMKSEMISIKYFIHVTLDIPHAIDLHVNLPIVVTTQSALKSGH